MPLPPIAPISAIIAPIAPAGVTSASAPGGGDFGKMISGLLDKLGQTEKTTTDLVSRAAAGDNVDIHDVMIATQAESLAFNVGVQVRNKLVEAYQEVFRMQM